MASATFSNASTASFSNDNAESHFLGQTDDGWSSAQANSRDTLHLSILDPTWLQQYPEDKQEEVFFRSILPVLVTRVDDIRPTWDRTTLGPIRLPKDTWIQLFEQKRFNLQLALRTYNTAPLACHEALTRYVVLERAKIMYERMWMRRAEFCLLGLSYICIEDNRQRSIEEESRETAECIDALRLCQVSGSIQFLTSCEMEAKAVLNVPHIPRDIENWLQRLAPTGHIPKDLWLVEHVRQNMPIFLNMKAEFEERLDSKHPASLRCSSRVLQITILGQTSTDSSWWKGKDSSKWKGEAVRHEVWNFYSQGPSEVCIDPHLKSSARWATLASNIKSFCFQAGSTNRYYDPLKNLASLLAHTSHQSTHAANLRLYV
ncbi:hypothetical protein BDZ45DRAFT_464492 [Acephala macrosclerotiorum]|nr:hypothetical protein BDZ45DRAFT_464492 [Acephala macrosclerotiorum]